MFEFVNEIAVLGTAFFMMAVAMIWYSEYLFQKPWMQSVGLTLSDIEKAAPYVKRNIAISFGSYVVAVYLIAGAIGYAEVMEAAVQKVAVLLAFGFAALLLGFVVWEQRSLRYYLITVGFSTVFILGSSFFLYYWPW